MTKKFLSVFLLSVLILTFTTCVYADHGEYNAFTLSPGEAESDTFYSTDLEVGDDDVDVSVVCDQSSASFILTLYDLTDSTIVDSKHFIGTNATYWAVKDIDRSHDYKIEIYNSGSNYISGTVLTVIR